MGVVKRARSRLTPNFSDPETLNDFFLDLNVHVGFDVRLATFYETSIDELVASVMASELVGEHDVFEILTKIERGFVGSDGIGIDALTLCIPCFLPVFVHLINFPLIWRKSMVVSVPKIHAPKVLKDVSPISILPTLSKVMERIMEMQFRAHLEKSSLLPQFQSDFRGEPSCVTALLCVTDDILRAMDAGRVTFIVLLDYSKAFGTINHKLLPDILHFTGLDGSDTELPIS